MNLLIFLVLNKQLMAQQFDTRIVPNLKLGIVIHHGQPSRLPASATPAIMFTWCCDTQATMLVVADLPKIEYMIQAGRSLTGHMPAPQS